MVKLDDTNRHILQLLLKDGRATVVDLARAVGRSESVVRERVQAMEAAGIIQGYTATLDWTLAGLPRTALIRASYGNRSPAEVARQLAAIPNVTQVFHLTGRKPLMATLRVPDVPSLEALLRSRIGPDDLKDMEVEVALDVKVPLRQPMVFTPGQAPPDGGAWLAVGAVGK